MKLKFDFNGKSVGYYRIDFILNNATQRYEKQPMIKDFAKVPTDLKVEETINPEIKKLSEYLLRGRQVNGKCIFHLGLEKSAAAPDLMYRSALNDTKKSEVHIRFSKDFQRMTMYVFNNLRVQRPARPKFQLAFISHLMFELKEWQ